MKKIIFGILFMFAILVTLGFAIAAPNGANTITEISSSSAVSGTAANHSALAGNVTEITIVGESNSQTWQGYFGNVSGSIQLADASGNTMYNWSTATPSGEIYASVDSAVSWGSIVCFDYATNGAAVETAYGIAEGNVDGLNETFTSTVNVNVGTTALVGCDSTAIFDSSNTSVAGNFDEALLWDGGDIVFASILENDLSGFDSNSHDFEMMVLEDGHDGDSATTTYFFYVELE